MPGTPTPNYGWPIPADNDPADAPHDFQALGVAIDTSLKATDNKVTSNTTNITANTSAITTIDARTVDSGNKDTVTNTPAAGWGTVVVSGRRFGPLCVVHWVATRIGTAIAAVASGNIPDNLVLTITEPTFIPHYSVYSGFGANQGSAGRFFLGTPSGALYISQYAPGIAINTNDILNGTIVYIGN
jgi:hypothetical protein